MNRNAFARLSRDMIFAALSMLAYAIMLIVSLRVLARGMDSGAARIAISLAPDATGASSVHVRRRRHPQAG